MCIAVAIVLNVVSMALESYQPSLWQRDYLTISNFFFNYIFGLECIIKLIAERPKGYFNNNWNRFDFFIVLISFVGVAVDESGATVDLNPTILRVLRVFRIFRILRAFRIFKAAKGLQSIVEALAKSLPAIGNLAALLLLLFFIYGILSVELYGNLCTTPDVKSPNYDRCLLINEDHLLDSHASFVNIGMALLTLWRVSTGDNWGAIMISCKLAPGERVAGALDQAKHLASTLGIEAAADQIRTLLPGCVSADELNALRPHIDCGDFDCESTCGTAVSPVFFCTFLCMSNFVLLNLVIAVLMEQLEDTGDDDNAQLTPNLTRRDFARIYWRWKVNAHKVQYLKTNPGGIRAALVARDSPEPTKLVIPDPAANGGEDDDMVERVSSGIPGPIDLPTLDDEHMLFASKAAAISASATSANTTSSQASKDTVQQGGKQSNPERFSPELHALQSEGWSPMKTEELHVDNASPVPSPNRSPSPSLDFPPTAQKALTSSQKSQNNAESPASQKALTSSQKSAEGPRYAEAPTAASELPTDIPRDAVG